MNRRYEVPPRDLGGWRLFLYEDDVEMGGGVFPEAEYGDAIAEGEAWAAGENERMPPGAPCSHQWIDPQAPPIARQPVAPFIEPGNSKAMQSGKTYICQRCRAEVRV